MTTFYTQIFTCSGCARKLRSFQLSSYHVFESEVFSDAYADNNPPTMLGNNIVFCPACDFPYWTYDIEEEDIPDDDKVSDVKSLSDIIPFNIENCNTERANYLLGLLKRGFAKGDTNKELLIRLDIWRIQNHNFRYKSNSKKEKLSGWISGNQRFGEREWDDETEEVFISNLKSIIELFEPSFYEEILLLAEIYREIGDFEKAMITLNSTDNSDRNKAYSQIKNEIQHKRKKVIKLNL